MAGSLSPLGAYTLLWACSTPLEYLKGPLAGPPGGAWLTLMLLLCLAAAMMPGSKAVTLAAFSCRVLWWLNRAPFMWASEIIGGLTDLAVVLHVLAAAADKKGADHCNQHLGMSMRRQVAWFYFFAGFWKLNTSFLDHRYSCASVFMAQLIDAYVPSHLQSAHAELVHGAIVTSPAVTVGLELGVGVLMLVGEYCSAQKIGSAGVLLALLLHIGIDVTPAPHNVANFSHKIGLRYLWFAPIGCAAALNEAIAQPSRVGTAYVCLGAVALAASVAIQKPLVWHQWTRDPWLSVRTLDARQVDWHLGAHVALTALLVRGLVLHVGWRNPRGAEGADLAKGAGLAKGADAATGRARASFHTQRKLKRKPPRASLLVHANTLLTILWAVGTAVLGITDNATPNMCTRLTQHIRTHRSLMRVLCS